MRNDVLKFISSGATHNRKIRQELCSPRYTIHREELYEIK